MINKNHIIIDNELYNLARGRVIQVNDDGTYDIKISGTIYKYPHIKNVSPERILKTGDIVSVGLEYESKKLPIIF